MKYPVRVISKAEHTLRAGSIVVNEDTNSLSDDEISHDYEWMRFMDEAEAVDWCCRVLNGTGQSNAYRERLARNTAEYLGLAEIVTPQNAV